MVSHIATQEESVAPRTDFSGEGFRYSLNQPNGRRRVPIPGHPQSIAEYINQSTVVGLVPLPRDQYRAREDSQQASVRLQKILQLLPSGVVILDSRGFISDCNRAAEALLGDSLKGASWRTVIEDNFDPRLDDGHEISLKNGKRISLLTRSLEDEPGQMIVLNDLTETRELQQQLSRHQRLSTMGKMISSLAHQIRTPLSAALLYTDNLKSNRHDDAVVTRYSNKVLSRLQNIERQIRDMLIFARGDTQLMEVLSIGELISSLKEATLDIELPNGCLLHWRIANEDCRIDCNSDALVGALLNLIENAVQASGENQKVVIQVALNEVSISEQASEKRLCISVEDEGSGIEAEMLSKLEEPFITTKSQGTGLGLAIVRSVTKSHHGVFNLKPRPYKGVCAEVSLPLAGTGRKS